MTALDDWAAAVIAALELPADSNDQDLALDLAREVAHGVMRPAAPLTAYLLGIAVGRGMDRTAAAAVVARLAQEWDNGSDAPDARRTRA